VTNTPPSLTARQARCCPAAPHQLPRTPVAANANEVWDIDNLVKPTLDAMEGVLGARLWHRPRQAADDRVDYLEASKRTVRDGESPGAHIELYDLGDDTTLVS